MSRNEHKFLFPLLLLFVLFLFVYRIRRKEAAARNNESDSFPQNRHISPGLECGVGEQLSLLSFDKNLVLREMGNKMRLGYFSLVFDLLS